MKKIILLLAITLGCLSENLNAQEKESSSNWYWGIYSSITPHLDTELQSLDFIRKDNEDWNEYYFDYVEGTFYSWNIGLNLERRILNNRLTLLTGIQYSSVISGMDAQDYGSSEFMLVNISTGDQGTEYLRVKGFEQEAKYLGIPIGIKYTPLSDHFVNLYIKAGLEFNVLLDHNIETDFVNASMKKYDNKVAALFSDPTSLYTTFNFRGGIKLGKAGQPNVTIDMGPTFILSDDPSSITTSELGFSFQINFLLPLKI